MSRFRRRHPWSTAIAVLGALALLSFVAGRVAAQSRAFPFGLRFGSELSSLHWSDQYELEVLTNGVRRLLFDTGGTTLPAGQTLTLSGTLAGSPGGTLGGGSLTVSGAPTFSGAAVFSGDPSFTGNPSFTGVPTFGGITPSADAAVNLGTSALRWVAGHFSSAVWIGAPAIDGAARLHVAGMLHVSTSWAMAPHRVSIAAGTEAASNIEILSGLRSLYLVDCNDSDGCRVQFGTTVANAQLVPGAITRVASITTNANILHFADVAAVQHVGTAITAGTDDVVSFVYSENASGARIWLRTGTADN